MTITTEPPEKFTLADNIIFALDLAAQAIVWGVGITVAIALSGAFIYGMAWMWWTALTMAFGDYRVWALAGIIVLIASAVRVAWRG